MIRFLPDTWQDALLRPIAMGAPDAWVYIEISAPDFRFALAIVLFVLSLGAIWRVWRADRRLPMIWQFCLMSLLSFVLWMVTSGNGRYFLPYLLLIGPVCVGLLYRVPCSKAMRMTLLAGVVAAQALALSVSNPWRPGESWELSPWQDAPYYDLDRAGLLSEEGVVYISYASPTYSLLAPMFPESSSWINLSAFGGEGVGTEPRFKKPWDRLVNSGRPLRLIDPARPWLMRAGDNRPNDKAEQMINETLKPFGLVLRHPQQCRFLRSRTLSSFSALVVESSHGPSLSRDPGFWVCDLVTRSISTQVVTIGDAEIRARQAFERMELMCPRYFPPGMSGVRKVSDGYVRFYAENDLQLISMSDGVLYVKYLRALNPQRIGVVDEVVTGKLKFDCTKLKGRAGLPWERGI